MTKSIWNFFLFRWIRAALGIKRSAEAQFTDSVQGIKDAFEIKGINVSTKYTTYRDVVAQLDGVIQGKRNRLAGISKSLQDLRGKRDGALSLFEKEEDEAKKAQHQEAFDRFDADIQRHEAEELELTESIKTLEGSLEPHMLTLTKLQAEMRDLPAQEAQAIAERVSAEQLIELNNRSAGLSEQDEFDPVAAVLKSNEELKAKARITERLAGTDVARQDAQYEAAGSKSTSRNRMQEMLAARKKEREGGTPAGGEKKEAETPAKPSMAG
jgi:hypothetical protein